MKINENIDSLKKYETLYNESIQSPEKFWGKKAERLNWYKKWNKTSRFDFVKGEIEWFTGGEINASYNCLDRHIEDGFGDDIAIVWEGNDPDHSRSFTYNELLKKVSEFANALKDLNVEKGDRVCLYMQMIPELAIAVLACARIGAVHSVVFGAFSSDSLRDRINDSKCKVLVTQDTGVRGEKQDIFMKKIADNAVKETPSINHVVVVRRTGEPVHMDDKKDIWWHEAVSNVSSKCKPEKMSSEDPLFILYTSGSTGKPKGVMHTTGGYLVYVSYTHEIVFNYNAGDVYWCTADLGWITGHSYIVYGPLTNRATTLMFEGVPNYPDYGRFWDIVDKHKVNQFYTAPTALRALMKEGNKWVNNKDLTSLRILGTVGEPIKEPEWNWYSRIIGKNNCPIVDTWWQTETGGILITPIPNVTPTKPGSATFPFFGIEPVLLTDEGDEIQGNNVTGLLAIKNSWPGQMRTIYGDHKRFIDVYFSKFPGYYFTGDGAKRDEDGYYWITGRVDDILCVSGHNIGTAEVEGAIGKANGVAEAAVVGFNHDVKGQAICAFVTLMTGEVPGDTIYQQILDSVIKEIGPHAKPDKIHFTPSLPKTRSGKIMRRILRKISEGDFEDLGDITTLADPGIVKDIISSLK
jgi:acetyl-CoA synthetase